MCVLLSFPLPSFLTPTRPAPPRPQVLAAVLHLGNVRFHDTVESGTPHAAVTRGGDSSALEDAAHCLQAGDLSSISLSSHLSAHIHPKRKTKSTFILGTPQPYHFLGGSNHCAHSLFVQIQGVQSAPIILNCLFTVFAV